jgi:predicted regulator of Ras-like GTPase activity (Roadblock/LC7/MglB family)
MNKALQATLSLPRLRFVAHCADVLAELRRGTTGVTSATLATADGLALASTLDGRQDADRLAAMAGSIAALASAMTRETGHGEPERVIMASASGHIVAMKVPAPDQTLVLAVVTDANAVLGQLLWACRASTDKILQGAALPA